MSKVSIILCALLFASVALAINMEEYNKEKLEFDVRMCLKSINRAGNELKELYSSNKLGWEGYRDAIISFNELRTIARQAQSVTFSEELTTYGGQVIFCNKDVADKVRDITLAAAGQH